MSSDFNDFGHQHQRVPPLLTKSAENVDVDPSDSMLTDERSELAFDVFKVPNHLLPNLPADEANLPVKVTAHRWEGHHVHRT